MSPYDFAADVDTDTTEDVINTMAELGQTLEQKRPCFAIAVRRLRKR